MGSEGEEEQREGDVWAQLKDGLVFLGERGRFGFKHGD